jgi:hypothetical protein
MSEQWRTVPSFSDYMVSDHGRVRHRRVNAPVLKGSYDKDGYHRVGLNGCTIRVHTIVAETFHGPRPEGFECAHLDGNCRNNAAANLAWVPHVENNSHKRLHGTDQTGERHPRARLTSEQVVAIRASAEPSRVLARQFDVNQSQIVRIRNGSRWARHRPTSSSREKDQ